MALGEKNYQLEGKEGPQYFEADYKDPEELREDSEELTAEILREGIVLLKNENSVLPLRKGASVSVFGKAAADPVCERRRRPSDSSGSGEDQGQR